MQFIYIYIYTYTCVYIYIHNNISTYIFVCIYIYHNHVCIYIYVYIYAYSSRVRFQDHDIPSSAPPLTSARGCTATGSASTLKARGEVTCCDGKSPFFYKKITIFETRQLPLSMGKSSSFIGKSPLFIGNKGKSPVLTGNE